MPLIDAFSFFSFSKCSEGLVNRVLSVKILNLIEFQQVRLQLNLSCQYSIEKEGR